MGAQSEKVAERPVRLRGVLLIAPVLLGCAAAYWYGSKDREAGQSQSGLAIAPKYLNFGEAWEQSDFAWELVIENRSGGNITISDFLSSCSCLAVEPPALTIPTGESARVRLRLDLTHRRAEERSQTLREFVVSLTPRIANSDGADSGWTITGQVRTAVLLSARQLSFGDDLIRGHPFAPRTLHAKAPGKLSDLLVECDDKSASVSVHANEAKTEYEVVVTPNAGLHAGPMNFALVLRPISLEGDVLPAIQVPVTGRVTEDVRCTPSAVVLGAKSVGDTAEERVFFSSRTGRKVELVGINVPSEETSVVPVTERVSDLRGVRVEQRISRPGFQTAQIELRFRSQDGTTATVQIDVSYYGLPAHQSSSSGRDGLPMR